MRNGQTSRQTALGVAWSSLEACSPKRVSLEEAPELSDEKSSELLDQTLNDLMLVENFR
jgi:hypothetical protein